MKPILCIDTTTEACSVALSTNQLDPAVELLTRYQLAPRRHAELVLAMVDEVLNEAKLTLEQLDAIAVTVGPGAFTGVRLGIAVAQGLAFAAALPIIPVGTLDTLARAAVEQQLFNPSVLESRSIAVAIDARMNQVYWGCFSTLQQHNSTHAAIVEELQTPRVCSVDEINFKHLGVDENWLFAGTGWAAYSSIFEQELGFCPVIEAPLLLPNAENALLVVADKLKHNKACLLAAELIQPLYLRDKVAETTMERLSKKNQLKGDH